MRDTSSILRSERSPGGGNGSPLQYSCLESPMDRGVWWAAVHVVAKSQMTEVTLHTHTLTCPLRKSYIVSSVQEAWWSTGVYGREAALLSPFPTLLVLGLNLQYPYPALLALRAVPCILPVCDSICWALTWGWRQPWHFTCISWLSLGTLKCGRGKLFELLRNWHFHFSHQSFHSSI